MELVKLLRDNWEVISANPWLLMTVAAAVAIIVWAVARFLYVERIASLKERLDKANDDLRRARDTIDSHDCILDIAQGDLKLARTEVDSLKVSLERARDDLKRAEAAIETDEEMVQFPFTSPNGSNILSPAVESVRANEVVGVRATIPKGRALLLKIEGLGPQQQDAAWSWSLTGTTMGWNHELYNGESSLPVQSWTAWEGTADLKFKFHRAGEVTLYLASDDGRTNVTKKLRILP
ncbi:hypothetical protein [Xanthomonas cerealis]|uniref:hypothetical protein n=1 Tax=Xanthomonas cerealis TaxID=3390025 RepID=UPI0005795658|nr:hypothetical protein [Xanthomonas translucens]UKE47038.1 hypothetical protein KHA79_18685 [Xanthomonas translucens pv. cerealis]